MSERELPWKSVEDFALQQPEYALLVDEALRELLSIISPQAVNTLGKTPQYRVKDANGNDIAFPITLTVEI